MDGKASAAHEDAIAYPNPRYAVFVLVVFFFAAALAYTDRLILNLLVQPIRHDLGLTDTAISLLQGAAFAVIYAFLGLPLGRAADRFNRRNQVLVGLFFWSVSTAACGLAHSFMEMFAGRIGVGIGEAALSPAVVSLLYDYFPPHRRGRALSVYLAGMIAGGGVANIAGGELLSAAQSGAFAGWPLLSSLEPWRDVLLVLALPAILLAIMMAFVREPVRQERIGAGVGGGSIREAVAFFRRNSGVFLGLILAFALLQIVDYGVNSWLPTLLMRRFYLSPAMVGGSVGSIGIVCGLVGALLGGSIADVLEDRGIVDAKARVAGIAATLLIPIVAFPLLAESTRVLVGFAIYSLTGGALSVSGLAAIQDAAPSELRGLMVSVQAFTYTLLGLGCGPSVVAITTDYVFRNPARLPYAMALVALPMTTLGVLLIWCTLPAFRKARLEYLRA